MQRLQTIRTTAAFVEIVKAIAYNYPALHRADEISPPHTNITHPAKPLVIAQETTSRTLQLSVCSAALSSGLKHRVNVLIDFLDSVPKPMYVRVSADGVYSFVQIDVWDDNSQ